MPSASRSRSSAADDEAFDAVVRTARPGIGSVAAGNVVTSPTVRVRVPVSYGEEVRYVLSAPLKPEAACGAARGAAPARGLDDRPRRPRQARHRPHSRRPGRHAGVGKLPRGDGPARPRAGSRAAAIEGRSAYTAYVTSELSGWILGIGIPASTVETGAQRTFADTGRWSRPGPRPRCAAGVADRSAHLALSRRSAPPHSAHPLQHRAHRAGVLPGEAPASSPRCRSPAEALNSRRRHAQLRARSRR